MTENPFSIAVLISGSGTTLRNLIDKQSVGQLGATIRMVISSNRAARGIEFARAARIDCQILDYREFATPESLSEPLFEACRVAQIDLVVMGGFLRRLVIPGDFANRVVNIHPSLIPAHCGAGMYGQRVHRAVLESGSRLSGCTVHFVDNQFDHGPVIARRQVPVLDDDTPETLAARVFQAECALYPQVINAIARGHVRVVDGHAEIDSTPDLPASIDGPAPD